MFIVFLLKINMFVLNILYKLFWYFLIMCGLYFKEGVVKNNMFVYI